MPLRQWVQLLVVRRSSVHTRVVAGAQFAVFFTASSDQLQFLEGADAISY